jgi:hypothetical protein
VTELPRSIGRGIVNHHDFEIAKGLSQHAGEGSREKTCSVMGWNDDADTGRQEFCPRLVLTV